jgi:hypothetical protein
LYIYQFYVNPTNNPTKMVLILLRIKKTFRCFFLLRTIPAPVHLSLSQIPRGNAYFNENLHFFNLGSFFPGCLTTSFLVA